jgi:hypothetical protein
MYLGGETSSKTACQQPGTGGQRQEGPRPLVRERLHFLQKLARLAIIQPLCEASRRSGSLMSQVSGHARPVRPSGHSAKVVANRAQFIRQPLLLLASLLDQLALSLAEQVLALPAALRGHVGGLLPDRAGGVLACLDTGLAQVSGLIPDHISSALILIR